MRALGGLTMRTQIACIILLVSHNAYACFAPPPEQHVPVSELISRTNDIVLASAIKAEVAENGWNVEYTFRPEKILKGSVRKEFTIIGSPPYHGAIDDFDHHRDKHFWERYGGRASNETDCEISPAFGVGLTYLIFLNHPYHNKSFELIIRTHGSPLGKDKWLQFIEQRTTP